jgi:stage II sporulation protein M
MKFRELFADFKHMKHYFTAASLVFVAGLFLGSVNADRYEDFIHSQLKGIEGIAAFIQGKEHQQLWLFWLIFWNNISKTIMFLYLGLFFGLLPLTILLINGMVLGFVCSERWGADSWLLIAKGILPHGIIEIPAVIIASAYGIRLGLLVLKGLLSILIPPGRQPVRAEITRVLKLTLPLTVMLSVALLIAAGIESTVTFWLMRK